MLKKIANGLTWLVVIAALALIGAYVFDVPAQQVAVMEGQIVASYTKQSQIPQEGALRVMVKAEDGVVFTARLRGTRVSPLLTNGYPEGTPVTVTVLESSLFKRREYQAKLKSGVGSNNSLKVDAEDGPVRNPDENRRAP